MSAIEGMISRRVLPACGSLCFFCPAMRARSRQPVKRYKKLIADIFPRNQEEGLNDRKIGKLCEYATKNPLRIPKVRFVLKSSIIMCIMGTKKCIMVGKRRKLDALCRFQGRKESISH
ncbi:hypothetical protein L484_004958 [Morus notabilis]|uniref:Uncharacterized protein n=1 Tax=Morus notabilis TaxID=981085 RepID=W9R042_9ROSA|nr:hypothetical protein L484_004958 [Morus notabilis]